MSASHTLHVCPQIDLDDMEKHTIHVHQNRPYKMVARENLERSAAQVAIAAAVAASSSAIALHISQLSIKLSS